MDIIYADSDHLLGAIAANVKLCGSVNVSIPDYLGCSPSLAEKFEASAATASRSTLNSQSTQVNAAPTYLVTGTVQSAVTVPSTGPVAAFTGRAIFTGTCTSPQYAVVTQAGGAVIEYPWAGCSDNRVACCPFDINVGGLLSVCPRDYTTTNDACCPSYVMMLGSEEEFY